MTNPIVEALDVVLTYLVDNVSLIRHRVELRHLEPAEAFEHNNRLKTEAKACIKQEILKAQLNLIDNFLTSADDVAEVHHEFTRKNIIQFWRDEKERVLMEMEGKNE